MRSTASSPAPRPIRPAAMPATRPAPSSEARGRGRVPIIVGGTGLYFKALLEGLSPVPPIDPERARALARRRPARGRRRSCTPCWPSGDPDMAARLMPTDPQRIVRALEVLESTGRSLADWQRQPRQAGAGGGARRCGCWCCRTARRSARASTRASTPCWLRAPWTRCAGCLRSDCRRSCRSCGRSGWLPLAAHRRGQGRADEAAAARPRPRRASTPSGSSRGSRAI